MLEEITKTNGKILIFAMTKKTVDKITRFVNRAGWKASCIHGDKSQLMRDRVLHDFRTGKSQILVATDVAARGLGRYIINSLYHF